MLELFESTTSLVGVVSAREITQALFETIEGVRETVTR